METTLRQNGKWAKVSGKRGRWASAHGWEGSFQAAKLHYWPTKEGAIVSARYWLAD